jgi:glycosyltransferase involved in cell wall biosynthesis
MIQAIDVCIPTLLPLDSEFTEHIRKIIPVHHLLTSNLKGRGSARQDLINRVDSDWFAFIDTDVRLKDCFWAEMTRYIDNNNEELGAIEGKWSYPEDNRLEPIDESMTGIANILHRSNSEVQVTKGFTGDTMIKTAVVKDITIPNINVWEDEWIRLHVMAKGKKWIRTSEVVCEHKRRYNLEEAYEAARYRYAFRRPSLWSEISNFLFKMPLRLIFTLIKSRSYLGAKLIFDIQLEDFRGCMHARVQRLSIIYE